MSSFLSFFGQPTDTSFDALPRLRHTSQLPWEASWIWPQGHSETVNFHCLARRTFQVPETRKDNAALLRITAGSDYAVSINGVYLGRGPEPANPSSPRYDVYDITPFLKAPGQENVLAVVCHNWGLGTHWQHRVRGGLLAQIDCVDDEGAVGVLAATDDTWRVRVADGWAKNAPRQFWSCGFAEICDLSQLDPAWLSPEYDDSDWETPEVLSPADERRGDIRLKAREIALLHETPILPVSHLTGRRTMFALHTVGFDSVLQPGKAGLVQAEVILLTSKEIPVILQIECDDAFRVWGNNELLSEQTYWEYFAATRVWRGYDEYEQVHAGMGVCEPVRAPFTLKPGENSVRLLVDSGMTGWGFTLLILDAETGVPLNLPFQSENSATDSQWKITGPWDSSGMGNSLQLPLSTPPELSCTESPFARHKDGVTDTATLMGLEKRKLESSHSGANAVTLTAGEWAIFDLGKIYTGYPELELSVSGIENGVLDVGYSQTLHPDLSIRFSNGGRMKMVDRVRMDAGTPTRTWQPLQRKALRYLHVSCRQGTVTLEGTRLQTVGYPVEQAASFETSDSVLNAIHETGVHTLKLLMQYGYQDCLKREQGTLNTSSFNYACRAAALCFGDFALARKNIQQAIDTQNETGWFDSHGISSPNSDEPTECLWWVVWLRDFYRYSGDTAFVAKLWDGLEDALRFFGKAVNSHGLLEGRNRPLAWRGQWVYLDDSTNSVEAYKELFPGETVGYNILWIAALEAAASLAEVAGRSERQSFWTKRAERAKTALSERFWDEDAGLLRDWRDGETTLAEGHHPIFQISALYFNQLNEAQTARVLASLEKQIVEPIVSGNVGKDFPLFTFGFYFYLIDSLFRHGRDKQAIGLIQGLHGRWIAAGATAFGEFISVPELTSVIAKRAAGEKADLTEYEIHAYGTSAHLPLYVHVLGITPQEPGFTAVRIAPKPGNLTHASGSVQTPQGLIQVKWRIDEGTFLLDVIAPPTCTVLVETPAAFADRCHVTVNGE